MKLLSVSIKRICCFVLTFLVLSTIPVYSQSVTEKSRIEIVEDSLFRELQTLPRDSVYIYKITGLELLLMDSPKFLFYADMKEKEARRQNRLRFVCESYSDRAIYYANNNKVDSFYFWKEKMDPLALELKEFNYYFFLCNLEVRLLLERSKIETAIQAAKAMYNVAKEYNSNEGLVASNMSMGSALLKAKRYKEAEEACEKALSLIPQDANRWNSWKMSILTELLMCCDLSGAYDKGLNYANQKQELVNAIHQKQIGGDTKKPFLIEQWMDLQLKKSHFYIKLDELANASGLLEDVRQYYFDLQEIDRMRYHVAVSDYYAATGNYRRALAELDICYPSLMERETSSKLDLMGKRAELLGHVGSFEEAVETYQNLLVLKDSISDAWFDSQLNELRTIYETDHLKLANSELELQSKHTQLSMALVICALSILALAFISILYVRLSRVKKDLESSQSQLMAERDHLVQSKENLRIAKEKAEEARDLALKAERKESFFANMSHEIRTPLNAIVGFSNLLVSDEEVSSEERDLFIATINQNCEQLLKLINDILDLSRMESGKMSFALENYNLSVLISEVYSTHKMMIPKPLEFIRSVPEKPLIANVDRMRLKQVVSNFINNAVKFTTSGHIRIGYELDQNEGMISMFVEDTGRGIPEEHQKKIFERFYKQNDQDQGTGLGLSICSMIAEKLGGRLDLHSQVGKGSRFMILLPYDDQLNKAN